MHAHRNVNTNYRSPLDWVAPDLPVPSSRLRRRRFGRRLAPVVVGALLFTACDPGATTSTTAVTPTSGSTPTSAATTVAPDTTPGPNTTSGPDTTATPTSSSATTDAPSTDAPTVVAFNEGGQVIWFRSGETAPALFFEYGSPNDDWEAIDISTTNGVGFISTCCEPATGAIYEFQPSEDPPVDPNPTPGYGVSISPNDRFVATGQFTGNPVSIKDLTTGEWVESDPLPGWADMSVGSFTPADIMWTDDQHLILLGTMFVDPDAERPEYVLYNVELDGDGRLTSASEAIPTGQPSDLEQPMQFAGRLEPSPGTVALYARGASNIVVIDPATGTSNPIDVAPNLVSVWYEPGHEITVDADGVLSIDGNTTEGNYLWARAT